MKKIFILFLLLSLTGCSYPLGGKNIPVDLKLKVDKNKILKDVVIKDIRCQKEPPFHCSDYGDIKQYYFVTDEIATTTYTIDKKQLTEDVSRRTSYSMTYKDEDKNISVVYSGFPQFAKELSTGKWYQVENSTTTIDAFDKQVIDNVSFIDRFIFPASATDSTVYSSTTIAQDGYVYRNGATAESYYAKRTGAGTAAGYTDTVTNYCGVQEAANPNYYYNIRSFVRFPTGDIIPSTANVTGAVLSIYGSAKDSTLGGNVMVDHCVPASTASIATGDYAMANHDFVSQSDTTIAASAWSTSGYNAYTLNATGLGNIGKGAGTLSNFGLKTSFDMSSTTPTRVTSNSWTYIQGYYADYTGTTRDPKLVVTWEEGGTPAAVIRPSIIMFD